MIIKNRMFVRKGDFLEPINETQKKIYEFLVERSQDGVPPSVREIGAAVGLKSTSSVQSNLDSLEKAGYIMRDPLFKTFYKNFGAGRKRYTRSASRHGNGGYAHTCR